MDEITWEQHYRTAEKLYADAERYIDGPLKMDREAYTETMQRALFHATMANAKVGHDKIVTWVREDEQWLVRARA